MRKIKRENLHFHHNMRDFGLHLLRKQFYFGGSAPWSLLFQTYKWIFGFFWASCRCLTGKKLLLQWIFNCCTIILYCSSVSLTVLLVSLYKCTEISFLPLWWSSSEIHFINKHQMTLVHRYPEKTAIMKSWVFSST